MTSARSRRAVAVAVAAAATLIASACGSGDEDLDLAPRPTSSTAAPTTGPAASTARPVDVDVEVVVDAATPGATISPLILGVSSSLTAAELTDLGARVNSWGGNPATRYNYEIGHAWNHGADFEFRNTNYGDSGDSARRFLGINADAGIESRVAVPTLGWVAKDDLDSTCSFPDGSGGCSDREEVGDCADGGPIADPRTANVESTQDAVAGWIGRMIDGGANIRFIAMDNEPELWGGQHYDVHPTCPTYEEILDKYLSYARVLRDVAPEAELMGPVTCCWFDYWRTAPGPADGSGQPFLDWFLTEVKAHDDAYGKRTLDVLDVHYYPQSGVFNDDTDAETNARRLRSTRALWDPEYQDESWITEPIAFIPRMKETIERTYPGTPLFISEWNFGADGSINGALAIADVLGVYGREGVYGAAYWRNPEIGSPGAFAFKIHGNYDGEGSRFGGRVLPTTSSAETAVSAFAALDDASGLVRVMLINKKPDEAVGVSLAVEGLDVESVARSYTYSPEDLDAIVPGEVDVSGALALPASSITVFELDARA